MRVAGKPAADSPQQLRWHADCIVRNARTRSVKYDLALIWEEA
jgi:hypothetical protein